MATLLEDIAALADDEAVMRAVRVLTDKGINGVMFEKLMAQKPTISPATATTNQQAEDHVAAMALSNTLYKMTGFGPSMSVCLQFLRQVREEAANVNYIITSFGG